MRRVLPLKIALASLLIAACVTINVYFPAAAADKAADQVINDITGGGAKGAHHHAAAVELRAGAQADEPNFLVAAFGSVLYALVPAAQAQDAEAALNVSSPAVTRIKRPWRARFGELEKFFASGAVGLTKDGMRRRARPQRRRAAGPRHGQAPGVRGQRRPRPALRARSRKASNHPEWEADIRKSFAKRWVVRTGAKPGWYYQDDGGAWKQK